MHIVNIISRKKGGGAELLVSELHKIYLTQGLDSHAVYFVGETSDLQENEIVFNAKLRSPLNIMRIRKFLKSLSKGTTKEIVVNVHLTWPFLYTVIASLGLPDVKLVYTEHNTINKRRKIPLFNILERLLYSRFRSIICISDGVHDSLAQWLGPKLAKRMITIPNGARILTFVERIPVKNRLPNLISVGSLSHRKNFITAISAVSKLRNKINSYIIIGEGPERSQLEKLIIDEGLADKVKLIGWSDDIEKELHLADIQLIPSLWEGFGLVAVEGMSTGLPVVASNVPGLREVLGGDNPAVQLVNEVDSIDSWVESITDMIEKVTSTDLNMLSQSSRLQAEKFTLDKMAAKYLSVYRQTTK